MSGKTGLTRWLITVAISLGMGCTGFAEQVIYVDADATGANDGTSWPDAYNYLQDALADADSAEEPVEIRVAQGVYRPDRTSAEPNGTGDREATFQLISGVAIRGGYAGFGEPDPSARDISAYESVLSGDLAGDDVDVNDPYDLLEEPTRAENSCHVVMARKVGETAILDGFTLTGGNSGTGCGELGAGLYNSWGSPSIASCVFISNCARKGGGGMSSSGSPTLTDCTFVGNSAGTSGGGMGNGAGTPSLKNCTFRDNWAGLAGGGMCNTSSAKLSNCRFSGNSAQSGGGMRNEFCSPLLTNCTFVGNSATHNGGGIDNQWWAGPAISNCVFSGNSAGDRGGGVYSTRSWVRLSNCSFSGNLADSGGAVSSHKSSVRLTNSILSGGAADDGPEIVVEQDSTVVIAYSCIQGGQAAVYDPCEGLVWAEGNIDADPLFADPNNGDYHLKSQAGRWDPNSQNWVKDDVTSPCIDAGYRARPIGNEPFPNAGLINLGAYGGTAQASKSYFGEPVCQTIVTGDINGDCRVDFADFAIMAFHWLEDNTPNNSHSVVKDGIEYYTRTDKSGYHLGENVQILYRVTNLRDEDVTFHFNDQVQHHFEVTKNGSVIWFVPKSGEPMESSFVLEPNGFKEYTTIWNIVNENGTWSPGDDFPAIPGTYRVTGSLHPISLSLEDHDKYVPVSVRIQIVP